MSECRLLAGIAALIAQLALAVLSFSGLYFKKYYLYYFPQRLKKSKINKCDLNDDLIYHYSFNRFRERPQRPTTIWAMDVSKQIIGMGAAHASGLLIAIIAHHATEATASECAWYYVAFSFDTTIGVVLTMVLHNAILRRLRDSPAFGQESLPLPQQHESWKVAVLDCGQYGDPPILRRWAFQAGEWSLCVVTARALCGGIVAVLAPLLQIFAEGLDAVFDGHPRILLFFVMVCCPLLMNAAQLLIQDAILKGRQKLVGTEDEIVGRGSLLLGQSQHALNVFSETEAMG